MHYQHYVPCPALAPFVDRYLVIHFQFDPAVVRPYKPYPARPEHYMTFTPWGFDTRIHAETGQTERVAPNAIFSQPVSRFNLYPSSNYLLVRVFFRPGALYQLMGVPLNEFTDTYIDTESLIGCEVRAINEQLGNVAPDYGRMVALIENYLLRKTQNLRLSTHHMACIAAILLANPTRFSLDYLADQACLSPRQFNRLFTEQMGVGPKLYSRIVRYYQAFRFREANPSIDWLSVALKFGFTDVQHLNKDFRQFAGITPNGLLKEQTQAPEVVLPVR
jgi:AraC-like DNA-binding protein